MLLLAALFLAIYAAALFSPSLLDDADATHANAARAMATTGDWVTLKVDGVRYLEKPPLPYWLVAISYRIFGYNTFATHLPVALGVLLLTLLGSRWSRIAWGEAAAFYTALGVLTSAGVFLFTRVFIPESLLSFFLAAALYCFLRGLELRKPIYFSGVAASLACAVLTKGLIAPVFFLSAAFLFLLLAGELRRWRELQIFRNIFLFFAIAAPWHILAGMRNRAEGIATRIPTPGNHHGFLWFYFINEHYLRFLGRRFPMDYNKLPGVLYWALHLVWLFPWSLFFPAAIAAGITYLRQNRTMPALHTLDFAQRTTLLLSLYSALVLLFFAISTNQEYYTFPAYLPLLMLTAAALVRIEVLPGRPSRWLTAANAVYTAIGVAAAATLGYGLWTSRHLPFVPDIGDLLVRRGVGNYTLSMSHFFDLTGESFAALRLPAALAALALAFGPAIAWRLRSRQKHRASTTAIALTSAVFLIAAHIALVRFESMLSSVDMAERIQEVLGENPSDINAEIYLYGDQSYGSSILFYTGCRAFIVNGRSSSLIWGSMYTDAPHIFLSADDLLARWGTGPRKFLFVPQEEREHADALLGKFGGREFILDETSGKALITDRPVSHLAGKASTHTANTD